MYHVIVRKQNERKHCQCNETAIEVQSELTGSLQDSYVTLVKTKETKTPLP